MKKPLFCFEFAAVACFFQKYFIGKVPMKQLKDLWIKIPFLKEFTGLEFSEYVQQLEKLADWQKRRVIGKNRNPDGVFPAVLNSIKNKEQFQQFKQKIHPFIEKEFQTYMGQNNVCFYIVDQDLFNKIMQPQTDFVQNFRWVPWF